MQSAQAMNPDKNDNLSVNTTAENNFSHALTACPNFPSVEGVNSIPHGLVASCFGTVSNMNEA